MHVALETGSLDLYKRAKQLNPSQAVEVVATNQGDNIKSEFDDMERNGQAELEQVQIEDGEEEMKSSSEDEERHYGGENDLLN